MPYPEYDKNNQMTKLSFYSEYKKLKEDWWKVEIQKEEF
jgi:hypothetical protein